MIDNIIYSAVFFNTKNIISKYPQVHKNLYSHHSTIEFKPNSIKDLPIGKKIDVRVLGRLTTDKVDVLLVENPYSNRMYPHITLSTADGIKPFESNTEIEKYFDKIIRLNDKINGIIGVFNGKVITKI